MQTITHKITHDSEETKVNSKEKVATAKLANAVPLTISSVILVIMVIAAQSFLSKRTNQTNIISISFEQTEQQEELTNGVNELDLSDEALLLASRIEELYVNDKMTINEIRDHFVVDLPESKKQKYSLLYSLAQRLSKQKKYTHAIPIYEMLSFTEQLDLGLAFGYAFCLSKINRTKDATEIYIKLNRKQPTNQPALINLGLLFLQTDRFDDARILFEKGIGFATGTHKAKVYAGLADAEYALKDFVGAIGHYNKSIEYRPTSSLTWKKLARAENSAKRSLAEVIKSYSNAVELSPKNKRLRSEYSNYLFDNMQYRELIKLLKKNLARSKSSIGDRFQLIISYIEQKRLSNAKKHINYLKKYTNKWQKESLEYFNDYLRGAYLESLEGFKRGLKKGRDNNISYYMIGLSYLSTDKPKNAAIYFKKIEPNSSLFNLSQYYFGFSKMASGESSEAQDIFIKLLKRLPNNNVLAFTIAQLAYRENDIPVALSAINTAISLSPKNKSVMLLEAKIKWRSGMKNQAANILSLLTKEHPRYKPALYRLADYYSLQKKQEESLILFRQLIDVDRNYSNGLLRVAEMEWEQGSVLESIDLVREYLQARSDDIRGRLLYAKLLCETGDLNVCEQQLNLILKFESENRGVQSIHEQYFRTSKTK